ELGQLAVGLREARLVRGFHRGHGLVVEPVELVEDVVGHLVLALGGDPDDHGLPPSSSPAALPDPGPSSAFILASSESTCESLVSSRSWRSRSLSPGPSAVRSSNVPAASSSS